MQVGSICTRHTVTIDAERPLTEAAHLMRHQHVGTLVVTCSTGQGTEVFGIVTDRDLVIDVMARDPLEMDIRVADLARRELAMIAESARLDEAIAKMLESGVRRLLVCNSDDQLCGVLSIDDLIQAFAEQIGGLSTVIRSGREREQADHETGSAPRHLPMFPSMGTAAQAWR